MARALLISAAQSSTLKPGGAFSLSTGMSPAFIGAGGWGVGAGVERALLDGAKRVAGEDDDGDVARARLLLEPVHRADTVEAGHGEVHHDHVGPPGQRGRHRSVTIGRHEDAEAAIAEVRAVHLARVGRVIDDENRTLRTRTHTRLR